MLPSLPDQKHYSFRKTILTLFFPILFFGNLTHIYNTLWLFFSPPFLMSLSPLYCFPPSFLNNYVPDLWGFVLWPTEFNRGHLFAHEFGPIHWSLLDLWVTDNQSNDSPSPRIYQWSIIQQGEAVSWGPPHLLAGFSMQPTEQKQMVCDVPN